MGDLSPADEAYIDDVRRHLEDGGKPPEVEAVEDECPTCGAYVLNHALHADFHRRQREQFVNLDQLARKHVPEPRYG